MKHKKLIVGIGSVTVVLMAAVGMLGAKGSDQAPLEGDLKGKYVQVAKATKQDIESKISSTGMIYAKDAEKVYGEVNTQIKEVKVEVGDTVKKGDVLFILDEETKENLQRDLTQLDLQLESGRIALSQIQNASVKTITEAELGVANKENALAECDENMRKLTLSLELAQEDLEKAQNHYDVTKTLYDGGLESKTNVDEASKNVRRQEDQVASLTSQVQTLEANKNIMVKQLETATYDLSVLRNEVQDETKAQNITMKQNDLASLELKREALLQQIEKATTQIVAPVDGVVAALNVAEGQFITPGAELIKIINPEQLIVKAEVSPYYAPQLEEGLKVMVKYNGSTTVETTGTITMVSPVAIQKAGASNAAAATAIPIEIALDEKTVLKEGLLVDLKIITEEVKDVVAVPLLATLEDSEEESYVFVVKEGGILEKRTVKEGTANNQYIQVSDLNEGEIVVTNPTEALKDGIGVNYEPFAAKSGENQ
ncbi:MAG: efflux RND transporter periplasmic adaptor subunit [Cellulosilyticaceae bacterium]